MKTRAPTNAAMELELLPYRDATASIGDAPSWTHFGAMISHASYPVIDGGANPGTLSRPLVNDLLRGDADKELALGGADKFAGIGLRGLAVSDAFWTWGAMRGLPAIERQRKMAQAFLAGMDILMISKTEFSGAWGYFQMVWANRLPTAEQAALTQAAGFASWDELRSAFKARVEESATRIREVKAAVGRSTSFMGTGPATNASAALTAEYVRLSQ